MKLISSRDNPLYKSLLKTAGDARQRKRNGLTLLDGAHLLDACLANGYMPAQIMLHADFQHSAEINALIERCGNIPVSLLESSLYAALSELKTPSGILSLLEIPQAKPEPAKMEFGLLLEDIQDPGNLGSMLRSAAAAGCDAVFLSQGCADAWSPRVLRAAMGGHFVLQIVENAALLNVTEKFPGTVYAASLSAKRNLYDCPLQGKLAFAIGNEGAGLSVALQEKCEPFIIPMPGAVESLNAAAAAAICLFEAVRRRT